MMKGLVTIAVCAALLCAGTGRATETPQQRCNAARVTAWKTYVFCMDTVIARDAAGRLAAGNNPEFAAFARCRHRYFKKWTAYQMKPLMAGSSCVATARFVDNGDGTITDNLSGLVWEKKTDDSTVHDVDNGYTLSSGLTYDDGTAFTTFLMGAGMGLNMTGFAGSNGWRVPTLLELQSIVLDFPCEGVGYGPTCSCGSVPCIDPTFGPTKVGIYSSTTAYLPSPFHAWLVGFGDAGIFEVDTAYPLNVRAVRGGL